LSLRVAGLLSMNNGWYDQAVAEYLRAIELDPANGDAFRYLGNAYLSDNQLEKAEPAFLKAIELDPTQYKNYRDLGNFFDASGNYREAEKYFKQAVALAPDEPLIHFSLSSPLINSGQFKAAEDELRSSIRLAETPIALHALGVVLIYERKEREAIRYIFQALRLGQEQYLWWMNLGTAYRRAGLKHLAKQAYRRGFDLADSEMIRDPRSGSVRANLAYMAAQLGDRRRAKTEIAEALGQMPNDSDTRYMAALTYEALGRRDDTLAVLAASPSGVIEDVSRWPDMADLVKDSRFIQLLASHQGKWGKLPMPNKYTIKFTKNGLTITEKIDQGTAARAEPLVEHRSLLDTFKHSLAANAVSEADTAAPESDSGPSDRPGEGGGGFSPIDRPGGGNLIGGGGPTDRPRGFSPINRPGGGNINGSTINNSGNSTTIVINHTSSAAPDDGDDDGDDGKDWLMANPFQIIKQTEGEWCWAAVGASIKNYFSPGTPPLRDCDVANAAFSTTGLCGPTPVPERFDTGQLLQDVLQGNLQASGVKADTVLSFEEIQTQIAASTPVCARIVWSGEFGGHFVVIHGWGISASGDRWVDVADPFYPNSTVLYESLVSSGCASNLWGG
jgi:Flp pilus assembly protein TadD